MDRKTCAVESRALIQKFSHSEEGETRKITRGKRKVLPTPHPPSPLQQVRLGC